MRATREHWKELVPLPAARKSLAVQRTFSPRELETLRDGFIPRDMDDRWLMFMEGDWLYIHRSWSGIGIYQVRFSGNAIAEAWVNRDPTLYAETDDESDSETLLSLLNEFAGRSS